ncbi:hypothetical protein ABPG72_012349 [Tetrahymena utriculariae]
MSTEGNHALTNGHHHNGMNGAQNGQEKELNQNEVQQISCWDFNILTVTCMEKKYRLAILMFKDVDLFQILGQSSNKFQNFLVQLSQKYDYRGNPFHNFDHGITVAHGIYYIIKQGITNKHLNQLEKFSLLFSALCHDVDHTGHSNAYETNSKSELFALYGSESPLEKHHYAQTIQIADDCGLFESITQDQLVIMKKYIQHNILATDMSKHNQIMNEFKDNLPYLLKEDYAITEQQKINLCGALVHAADIGAPTRDFSISKEWSLRIAKEFTAQFELEQQNKLPVTPFYKDLDKYLTLATNEIGFINFFIKPFWVQIQQFGQGKLEQVSKNIDQNILNWKKEKEQEEQKLAEVKS